MTEAPKLGLAADFLMKAPLYSERQIDDDPHVELKELLGEGFLQKTPRIDGHCPHCQLPSTFILTSSVAKEMRVQEIELIKDSKTTFNVTLACARYDFHTIQFYIRGAKGLIQKIGQHPSLADIANDESKTYTPVLDKEDARELHKAIGLAAHGVGIGSCVYLRRVFEHLIRRRFEERKAANNWSEGEFKRKRMEEKIEQLSSYLPPFLVKNRKIYSLLSLGIHELDEDECNALFDPIFQSIVYILEEDKQAREKAKRLKVAEDAIAKYVPPGDEQ